MVEGTLFIGSALVGATQFVKLVSNEKTRAKALIIVFAVILGALVAVIDKEIGVTDLTVAEGIMIGLAAPGVVTIAAKVGGK